MNILPNKIKKEINCKISATIHEYECFTLKRKIRNYLNFKNLDKIIVAEEEFIGRIKKDFKKADVRYIEISSNIPRSKITKEEREVLKEKYKLNNSKVISFFGFALPSKGIEQLLRIISKLDDVKLLFINELDKNNEYHMSLLKLIKDLNIEERVIITGFLEEKDVSDMISISDVAILPFTDGVKSRNGSFLASYNQNIPVITTAFDRNDENGIYYVEPKDEEKLLEKTKKVLNEKQEIIRKELTWELVCKKYIESFEEVMKNDGENNKK
ncbi:MAG: glycosyltransferase [Clostridia bacterium]|jgi:glycosyltransferase involved in cell wall biosynthesis|nr:glycosyltransferase [Clostridia bacterium]